MKQAHSPNQDSAEHSPVYRRWSKAALIRRLEGLDGQGAPAQEAASRQLAGGVRKLEREWHLLSESRDELADLFYNAPFPYITHDVSGIITDINGTGATLLEKDSSLIRGTPLAAFIEPDDLSTMTAHLRRCKRGDPSILSELRLKTRSGRILDVELVSQYAGNQSKFLYRTAVIDLTEQKKIQGALLKRERELVAVRDRLEKRSAQAERRAAQLRALAMQLTRAEDRERRRLAELLHDDLQQVLVAARMKAEFVQSSTADAAVREKLSELTQLLREAIGASRGLTRELTPPMLHDQGLIAAIEWLAREFESKYGLEVELKATGARPPFDDDLSGLLFQTIRELLFNVIKHARTKRAVVRMAPGPDGTYEISVKDDGAGFNAKQAREAAGTFGLLAIGERMEHLGGALDLRSAPGKGTTATVRAPIPRVEAVGQESHPSVARGDAAARKKSHAGDRIHVLLVDDHQTVRAGLASLLAAEPDIEVSGEASNGPMALELVQRVSIDVAVMDITMPGVNGIETTRQMRQIAPWVGVVGLSMHEEADMAAAMLEAGANRYVAKGGPCEELLAAIRETAADRRPVRIS